MISNPSSPKLSSHHQSPIHPSHPSRQPDPRPTPKRPRLVWQVTQQQHPLPAAAKSHVHSHSRESNPKLQVPVGPLRPSHRAFGARPQEQKKKNPISHKEKKAGCCIFPYNSKSDFSTNHSPCSKNSTRGRSEV